MTLDEIIKYTEKLAGLHEDQARVYKELGDIMGYWSYEECAKEHRQIAAQLKELKKDRDREILNGLNTYSQSSVVHDIINQIDMRNATKEEKESVKQYIDDSAQSTGVNFWSLIGKVNTNDEL